jgi:hypothetical protein
MRIWNQKINWAPKDLRNALPAFGMAQGLWNALWKQYIGHSPGTVTTRHYIPRLASAKLCACGREKTRIGQDDSEQLEFIPASLFIIQHVRPKYACAKCHDGVVQAPMPAMPIERGAVGPGLLAHIITSKYADHVCHELMQERRLIA